MMFELLVKCAALITVIHGLRAVCRRIGPRFSGLLLGLPSSTATALYLCARERGAGGVSEMAEASLLGLVAAVALPLVYVVAVGSGWRLPAAIGASISAYFVVAAGLGFVDHAGPGECLGIALGSIFLTSLLAGRIEIAGRSLGGGGQSSRWLPTVRIGLPATYVIVVGIACGAASPRWAGLVSTFPSMSTVLLTVTHLEGGPAEAVRIAQALPSANLSTAVFLAAFRASCPLLGPEWAMVLGYAAALTNLAAGELFHSRGDLGRLFHAGRRQSPPPRLIRRSRTIRARIRTHDRSAPSSRHRHRSPRRKCFAPHFEALLC